MRKVYYHYDPKTRIYKRVYPTLGQKILTYLYRGFGAVLIGGFFFIIYYYLVSPPSVTDLIGENSKLRSQYSVLSRRVDEAMLVLHDIEQRDDNLYRVLLEADPISEALRLAGYSGTNRYAELMSLHNAELVVNTAKKVDLLSKRLFLQTKSFDEIVELSKEQENKLNCLPAIQPVSNKDLKRTASGYGYRMDPIYHTRKFHYGMDFACDTGTPVYATGDGVIVYAKWETGYGNLIKVDHGFGYATKYAHLSEIDVKKGQKVTRGEVIGKVGTTGKSTGPHLHYEVLLNEKNMNPVNYYFMDLDAEQYELMIQIAENHGKVFD